jgi:UDP-glucose 4-epimerase
LGRYFKIASDIRNLNYELYFSKGNKKILKLEDYSSNKVKQLNQKETEKILINLDLINNKKEKYFF